VFIRDVVGTITAYAVTVPTTSLMITVYTIIIGSIFSIFFLKKNELFCLFFILFLIKKIKVSKLFCINLFYKPYEFFLFESKFYNIKVLDVTQSKT